MGRWFTRTHSSPPVDASAEDGGAYMYNPPTRDLSATRLHVMLNGGVPAKSASKSPGRECQARDLPDFVEYVTGRFKEKGTHPSQSWWMVLWWPSAPGEVGKSIRACLGPSVIFSCRILHPDICICIVSFAIPALFLRLSKRRRDCRASTRPDSSTGWLGNQNRHRPAASHPTGGARCRPS